MDDIISSTSGSTVSPKRWIVLAVVVFLNTANAIIWLSFASVANITAKHYNVPEKFVDQFSLVFCIATVVAGLLVVWIVDKRGLRVAILVGAWLNCLGAAVRVLSRLGNLYPVAMTGQVLGALAQPFLYCIATKVAEQWFPDHQRSLATSMAVMANLVGQLIAAGVTPQFVNRSDDIYLMNIYYGIPCFLGAVIATFSIRSSKPACPPSCSAAISTNYHYFPALKTYLAKMDSLLLLFGVGSVLGVSYTLVSRMEEILCTRGYDNKFSGYCSLTLMGCGLLGAILASALADRRRSFIPIIKITLAFMVLSLCFFNVMVRLENMNAYILTACGLVGFWGYAAFPVGLELAMEHSFTILPEATSTGLILIAGQLLSVINFGFFETLSSESQSSSQKCTKTGLAKGLLGIGSAIQPKDSTCPLLILAGMTTFFVVLFILFFKSDYNRMKSENRNMSAIINDDNNPIASSGSFDDPSWHNSIYS